MRVLICNQVLTTGTSIRGLFNRMFRNFQASVCFSVITTSGIMIPIERVAAAVKQIKSPLRRSFQLLYALAFTAPCLSAIRLAAS